MVRPKVDYDNVSLGRRSVHFRGRSDEDNDVTLATSGRKLFRYVAVSFGILCVLQAALNISLRLTLLTNRNLSNNCDDNVQQYEAIIKNLTEEIDELKKMHIISAYSKQGWLHVNNSLYYKSTTRKSWHDSREYCLQIGADLLIINTKEEQEFARKFKPTWIGLSDNETEGAWKWVDGTPLSTSYWSSDEPNNAEAGEDCAEIGYYNTELSWNDMPCHYKNYWMCEKTPS